MEVQQTDLPTQTGIPLALQCLFYVLVIAKLVDLLRHSKVTASPGSQQWSNVVAKKFEGVKPEEK